MPEQIHSYNLPVYTTTGRYLGRIVDVEVEALGRAIVCYHVVPPFSFGNLWCKRLLITPAQVVKITYDRMVVEDSVVQESVAAPGVVPEVS